MKNKIIIFAVVVIISIPQIVSAAWWNPSSWFEEKKVENYQSIEEFITQQTPESISENTTLPSKQEPEIIEKTVIKEVKVPVEKIIEKVVTKPDQSVLDENLVLKQKIKELETKLTYYISEINLYKSKTEILENKNTNLQSNLGVIKEKEFNLFKEIMHRGRPDILCASRANLIYRTDELDRACKDFDEPNKG